MTAEEFAHPYKNPTCRGSYMLRSACGRCERCADERRRMEQSARLKPELDCAQAAYDGDRRG